VLRYSALCFLVSLLAELLLHVELLRLPYFWDEAGYYIPAARDLYLHASLIPQSTPSNAHPPLLLAYLAGAWKIAGFSPVVTRAAMLVVAAFSLLGVFRLARRVANSKVAMASTLCTAVYPVFFTQSSMAHLDLAAAGLSFWGLAAYLDDRRAAATAWFSLAALTKETIILTPLALLAWELVSSWIIRKPEHRLFPDSLRRALFLLIPILPLFLWYAFHYTKTGHAFGNPEFIRYNVTATLSFSRILLAFGMRLWQLTGYLNLYILTVATLIALWLPPLRDEHQERPRIAIRIQLAFLFLILTHAAAMGVVGGAELARYLLPVLPLVIMICVSTLWRRVRLWRWVIAMVIAGFLAGLWINPPYGFAVEDNLAYRDFIRMHENSAHYVEARYPSARILTAWPASDELTQAFLGYVSHPMHVVRVEDFSLSEMMSAVNLRDNFDVALVFSTKYEPAHPLIARWPAWDEIRMRYFGYHRDMPPDAVARLLGGEIVHHEASDGQWVAIIEIHRAQEARR
jgi:hypothetical protein